MNFSQVSCLLMVLAFCFFKGQADATNCSQCNMRARGIANTCVQPRNMTNCLGCMKTVTKVRLRDSGYIDGWLRTSVVTSRYCMRPGAVNAKPAGCYKQENNGGYTERCFCYTDFCNSGVAPLLPPLALFSAVSPLVILALLIGLVLTSLDLTAA